MKRAFTLIELLVVIAIIAILAAILFPVFAQAKLAAKKTTSLSNVKQLSTAYQMYLSDWDDTTISIPGNVGEWWVPLFPYFKTVGLLYSSEREDADSNAFRRSFGVTKLSAYGYNWGPFGWRGGGLLEKQVRLDSAVFGTSNVNRGISATSVVESAKTFVYGDTYDTPRATLGLGFAADTYNGFSNSGLRYGGSFNYAFLDGHAKALPVRGGILPGAFNDRFIRPADVNTWGGAFCADPEAIIQPEDGSTSNLNSNPRPPALPCGQYAKWLVDTITTPCAGNSTSSPCFWTN
jgi:prepilin-type N-terminal cleavage/methylation domain-containing protein/prepilin-type processing-associated H-X9-DG protein